MNNNIPTISYLAPKAEPSAPLSFSGTGRKAKPVILNRWQSFWAIGRIRLHLVWLILRQLKNPFKTFVALRTLVQTRRKYLGDSSFSKVAKVAGRYYYEYNTPGWPSQAYDDYHLAELNRVAPFKASSFYFKNVVMAVTKKCALKCEHCFEWEALNGKEKLNKTDLISIAQNMQETGVGQLQFSGGEPMLRMPALLSILQSSKPITDFWVITSGHLFTKENALALKNAGLTGVTISLDHVDASLHNHFRGFPDAFDWAKAAAYHAGQAGLVVALSLCATREFVTEENLMRYAQLANQWGACFIQVLEPRAVGHYAGQSVNLSKEQQVLLEDFYTNLNYNPIYHHLPMVVYYDFQRRRATCASAADRHVYIDTDGQLHACPFCRKVAGSALDKNILPTLTALKQAGCPVPSAVDKSVVQNF